MSSYPYSVLFPVLRKENERDEINNGQNHFRKLYFQPKKKKNGKHSKYKTEIFNYPYGDEATDFKAEIIIDTKNDIDINSIKLSITYLKYNKSWLLLLSQDDCMQSAFCRT